MRNAFLAEGADVVVTSDPRAVVDSSAVVVPGVGAFGKAMQNLMERKLVEPVKACIRGGKPFLGICLGLQLLFSESNEGGSFEGFDLLAGSVRRLDVDLKVPHIGWNQIEKQQDCPELDGVPDSSFFYFVHSYHVVPDDAAIVATRTEYGVRFVSAIKKDNVFASQFHPERSGGVGLRVIRNFMRLAKAG